MYVERLSLWIITTYYKVNFHQYCNKFAYDARKRQNKLQQLTEKNYRNKTQLVKYNNLNGSKHSKKIYFCDGLF